MTRGTYPRTAEHRKAISDRNSQLFSGRPKSTEHRRKLGDANRGNSRPDLRELNLRRATTGGYNGEKNGRYGKPVSEETREKMSDRMKEHYAHIPPELRHLTPDTRRKISEVRKGQWQDPTYVAKLIKAMNTRPNKVEARLIKILETGLPDFKYNGDYRLGVSLGGLIPDFVNTNGKKQVIEILGRYWHSAKVIGEDVRRTAAGKIAVYDSLGHKCLILWDDDLVKKSDAEILESVVSFSKEAQPCRL